jgi:hypothetical protein
MGTIPGLQSTDALIAALSLLCTAVGLSTASRLRAYLPLLAAARGSHIPTAQGGHLVYLTRRSSSSAACNSSCSWRS